jgi:DHA1 family bicyclomycin/chloramphenicol resistance-like MFS transporter
MDIYLPGLPEMGRDLGVSQSLAGLTIATFLFGMAAGQLVAGPFSDVFGRRRPILVSLGLFAIASLACAAAPTIGLLAGARFFQGVCATAGTVVARAVIRDVYTGAAGARVLSRIIMVYGLAPAVAPLVGAQVLLFTDWRGTFFLLLGLALVLAVATAYVLPETLPPARRRSTVVHAPRHFALLLGDRAFLGYTVVVGLASAALISYISASSFVIEDVFGVSAQGYAGIYALCGLSLVAGSQVNAHLLARVEPRRLLGLAVGAFVGVGLCLLVLTAVGADLWAVIPFFLLIFFSWGFVPANAMALAMAEYPHIAGSASALLGVSQFGLAAVVAPLVGLGGEGTAVPMAVSILLASLLSALFLHYLAPAPHPRGQQALG